MVPPQQTSATPLDLADRLGALSVWLARWRPIWSHRPFVERPAPWERDHPEVSAWLRALSPAEVAHYDEDAGHLAQGPPELAAWVDQGRGLTAVPAAVGPADGLSALDERWERSVSGRKRSQVRAFVGAVEPMIDGPPTRWLEWCAGNGHLGRALALTRPAPVIFVERRTDLAERAGARARREGVEASARVADVLRDEVVVPTGSTVVGLHACGALSDAAIARAIEASAPTVALMPCCYHYQPGHPRLVARSRAGQRAPLDVHPQQLRFATAEEVAAPARRRRAREREEAFRLAFDRLRREASGEDRYHHLPPVPRTWLRAPFERWARRVAEAQNLALPAGWSAASVEAEGWAQARLARALGLARTPFRRALELWYVLDRALWLADAGYDVQLRRACSRAVTPRNLIIVARRGPALTAR